MRLASTLTFCGAVACAAPVHAIGRLADVSIVDRETGTVLATHYYQGEYWIAGQPGSRYAIQIRNQSDRRLLAVTAVDGVNVLNGATAAWDQTGYVFGARDDYRIAGWRKSDTEVAGFVFTAAADSYASRTQRPENLGVIGVAVFRESSPPPVVAAPAPEARRAEESSAAKARSDGAFDAPALGTGHGARENSIVSHTQFERAQTTPDEIIRIRYDSLQHLLALGIITRPQRVGRVPQEFPGGATTTYVPDPPSS